MKYTDRACSICRGTGLDPRRIIETLPAQYADCSCLKERNMGPPVADAGKAFGLDKTQAGSAACKGPIDVAKRNAAEKLFARITEFAPTSRGLMVHANDVTMADSDVGFLSRAFRDVCEGLAATAPEPISATLESFAEPLRAYSFLDDLVILSNEQLAYLCALRGLRVVPIELASCGSAASVHAAGAPTSTIKDPDQP